MELRAKATKLVAKLGTVSEDLIVWAEAYISEGQTLLPWTLLGRAGILIVVVLDIFLHPTSYAPQQLTVWWGVIVSCLVYILVLTLYAWRDLRVFASPTSQRAQVALDTFFFALFYFLSADPESYLAFAFLVPLLIAARYFGVLAVVSVFGFIVLVLASTLIGFALIYPPYAVNYSLGPIFVVRASLLAGVTFSIARSEFLKRQMQSQTREYRRQLDLLVTQGVEFAQRQEIASLLAAATETARRELRAEAVSLFHYQEGRFRRRKTAGIEDDWFSEESYAPGEGITGQVGIGTGGTHFGKPILDNQAEKNPLIVRDNLAKYKEKLKSGSVAHLLAVPLNGSNRTFGILRAVNKLTSRGELDPKGFTADDQHMLYSIGALVALAMSSATRERKLQAVFEVNETLIKTFDERRVCQRIAEVIVEVGYRACCVILRETDGQLRIGALCGFSSEVWHSLQNLGESVYKRLEVLRTGQSNITVNLQSSQGSEVSNWAQVNNLCSVLRLPLFQQEQVIGILEIYTGTESEFYPDEISTLEVFAVQATMAIMNARLSAQNRNQINRLSHLYQVAQTITETGELRDVLPRIAKSAVEVVPADLTVISPYDVEKGEFLVDEIVTYGQHTDARPSAKPREGGFTQEVLRARNGYIVVEDLHQEPEKLSDFTRAEGVRSLIAVALKVRNVPVGVLYCNFRRPRRFTDEEIRNVQTFGELAAIAIHNAKLFTSQIQTVKALSAFQQLTQAALTQEKLDSVLDVILDTVCNTLGFELCTVSLVNEADNTIEMRKGRGVSDEWVRQARHNLDSRGIQADIVRTGKTEVIAGWDDRFDRDIFERFGHGDLIRVFTPIRGQKRIIGTVEAGYSRKNKPSITDQEVNTLTQHLQQVALVIENARLLEQERRHAEQLRQAHQQLTSNLDSLSDEIVRSYHLLIGSHLAYVGHVMENLLSEKLGPLTPKQTDRLGKAMQELSALKQRIERLLLVRRLEEGHLQIAKKETTVSTLVLDAISKVRPWIEEKAIDIVCDVDGITCTVELIEETIESILDDLLVNAIKFTAPGGRIEVRGEELENEVIILIADSGIGIAPQYLEAIFEKYFQVKPLPDTNRNGVGLGLYFARKFIEMHGGKIWVQSQLGKGSTFYISLPKSKGGLNARPEDPGDRG